MAILTSYPTTNSIIEKWKPILGLEQWTIEEAHEEPHNSDHLMECVTTLSRKHAAIRIGTEVRFHKNFEKYIVHEMIHPLLESIRAEHILQMKSLDTDRREEYEERIYKEVEKAVVHLTDVLYRFRDC